MSNVFCQNVKLCGIFCFYIKHLTFISTGLTLYKWRKILDAMDAIWTQGQLLQSLFIYWCQTHWGQRGSTFVSCLTVHKRKPGDAVNQVIRHFGRTMLPCQVIAAVILLDAGSSATVRTLPVSPVCLAALGYQPIHTAASERQRGLDMINQLTDQRA